MNRLSLRPHQALTVKTPAQAYAIAAKPLQISLGHYISALPNHGKTLELNHRNEAAHVVMPLHLIIEMLLESDIGTRDVLNATKGLRPVNRIPVF